MSILKLQRKKESAGTIEIKNKTEKEADLYFYGDIVSESWITEWESDAQCPKTVADFLSELKDVEKIHVYFNSAGGDVFAGLAIAQQLKRYKAEKIGHIDGLAASIAGVMLMESCDIIIVPCNAMFMMHKPLCRCYGNANDFKKQIEILDKCQETILNAYMSKAKEGITNEQITELINKETWLTGKEMEDYFQVQLEGEIQMTASCNSTYYDYYKKVPFAFKNSKKEEPEEIERFANLLAEKLKNMLQSQKSEKQKRKEEILRGLDRI